MGKRRRYTEEFKREAVRLLETRGERSAAEVAEGLGVSPSLLFQWRKQLGEVEAATSNDRGESKDEELARLRREVTQLRKEKDVLKKSTLLLLRDKER